jgi:hypothetical protein
MFGWKGDSLQRAMDARCGGPRGGDCPQLKSQPYEAANSCRQNPRISETIEGCQYLS